MASSYAPNVIIVPVPVPVAGPDYGKQTKPRPYPLQRREHWNGPPSKAAATVRLLNGIAKQEADLREFLSQLKRSCHHG